MTKKQMKIPNPLKKNILKKELASTNPVQNLLVIILKKFYLKNSKKKFQTQKIISKTFLWRILI